MRASNELEIRPLLINTAAGIIAREGLGRATTKNIAQQSGVNENYIYRYFEDKDDLLKQMFLQNDWNLSRRMMAMCPVLHDETRPLKERFRSLYMQAMELMLSRPEHAIAYLRFFFSCLYEELAKEEHLRCYSSFLEELYPYFKNRTEAGYVIHYAFDSILTVVYEISLGQITPDDKLHQRLFEMLFTLLCPCLKDEFVQNE